jgi:hypothetical protein
MKWKDKQRIDTDSQTQTLLLLNDGSLIENQTKN